MSLLLFQLSLPYQCSPCLLKNIGRFLDCEHFLVYFGAKAYAQGMKSLDFVISWILGYQSQPFSLRLGVVTVIRLLTQAWGANI